MDSADAYLDNINYEYDVETVNDKMSGSADVLSLKEILR